MQVAYKDYTVDVVVSRYLDGKPCIQLIGSEGSEYAHEKIAMATVNHENAGKGIMFIKDYSENEGMLDWLITNDYVSRLVFADVESGFVTLKGVAATNKLVECVQDQSDTDLIKDLKLSVHAAKTFECLTADVDTIEDIVKKMSNKEELTAAIGDKWKDNEFLATLIDKEQEFLEIQVRKAWESIRPKFEKFMEETTTQAVEDVRKGCDISTQSLLPVISQLIGWIAEDAIGIMLRSLGDDEQKSAQHAAIPGALALKEYMRNIDKHRALRAIMEASLSRENDK